MMIMTDQLLCITEATGSKIYTRELEARTHDRVKTLVLSLNIMCSSTNSMKKEQLGPW